MKSVYLTLLFLVSSFVVFAQRPVYSVKVLALDGKTASGILRKVNAEGVGLEVLGGNYHIFRTKEIAKISVKKLGRNSFGKTVAMGTLYGLSTGLTVWSAGDTQNNDGIVAVGVLTGVGTVAGLAVATISDMFRPRWTFDVNGNFDYFKSKYQELERFVVSDGLNDEFSYP